MKRLAVTLGLLAALSVEARAWVISDTTTDVLVGTADDLLVTRRVRQNVQLKAEEDVWEFFSRATPNRPVMGVGFQKGKFAHHWEWEAGFEKYPKKVKLATLLGRLATGDDGKAATKESDFRSLVTREFHLSAAAVRPDCGALLKEKKDGYELTVGTFSKTLNWVHRNVGGNDFVRKAGRCYEDGTNVVGVIVNMTGTASDKTDRGTTETFPGYSSETLIWTFEPPRS